MPSRADHHAHHRKPALRSIAERNALVVANLGLVRRVAKRWARPESLFDDLFSAGQIGLLRAGELYDPATGYQFSTFATMHILLAIQREFPKIAYPVQLPPNLLRQKNCPYSAACVEAGERIANAQHVGWEEMVRLGFDISGRENRSHVEGLYDYRSGGPGDDMGPEAVDRRDEVAAALAILPLIQRDTLRRRFGLNGCDEQILREIGEHHEVSWDRVRQREAAALTALRAWAARQERALTHPHVVRAK